MGREIAACEWASASNKMRKGKLINKMKIAIKHQKLMHHMSNKKIKWTLKNYGQWIWKSANFLATRNINRTLLRSRLLATEDAQKIHENTPKYTTFTLDTHTLDLPSTDCNPSPTPTPPYPTSFLDPTSPSHPLHIGVHLDKASQGARLAFATEPHTPAVLPNQNTKDGENGLACIDGSYKEGCDKTHTKKMVHQPTCWPKIFHGNPRHVKAR